MTASFPGGGYFSGISNAPPTNKICSDTTFNGATGSASCGSGSLDVAMGSAIHRTKGGTPTQLTIAGEKSAGDTLATDYREIPDVNLDDEGVSSSTNVTKVTRGTSVWNGAVSRKVCGMGIATISGRITDCDTQHSTKPSWDDLSVDGKISWNGAVHGNTSEGSWTLVTVYDASKSNGDTCAAACREVWRDDRTGLLWSDQLGDLSANANQGRFNWCLAAGNTQNAGSLLCTAGGASSYNKQAISLCAEGSGLTTPAGIHSATTTNDLASWANSGTTIRDSKGGMLKSANSDPAGLAQSPSVRWRLPTKNDWQLADVNGLPRVVPNSTGYFWAATIKANSRNYAWFYYADIGYTSSDGIRSGANSVRCVGR